MRLIAGRWTCAIKHQVPFRYLSAVCKFMAAISQGQEPPLHAPRQPPFGISRQAPRRQCGAVCLLRGIRCRAYAAITPDYLSSDCDPIISNAPNHFLLRVIFVADLAIRDVEKRSKGGKMQGARSMMTEKTGEANFDAGSPSGHVVDAVVLQHPVRIAP